MLIPRLESKSFNMECSSLTIVLNTYHLLGEHDNDVKTTDISRPTFKKEPNIGSKNINYWDMLGLRTHALTRYHGGSSYICNALFTCILYTDQDLFFTSYEKQFPIGIKITINKPIENFL